MPDPLISIVIPTRDRPRHLEHALSSIVAQTYQNFEVIVCDNYSLESARPVYDKHADSRFRYIHPDRPLTMSDNWELGVSEARGDYVGVLIDKTFLLNDALERTVHVLNSSSPDFVSWGNGAFFPEDQTFETSANGKLIISEDDGEPYNINLREELKRRCEFGNRLEDEGIRWSWGKICFGLFSKPLLNKIHSVYGRFFCGIVPDHDSSMAALAFGNSGIFLNQTLQVSIVTTIGTGMTSKSDSAVMRRFIEFCDPTFKIVDAYPIPGAWASPHNGTAYSYQLAIDKFTEFDLKLNLINLAKRTSEDLSQVVYWSSLEDRVAQYRALWSEEIRLGIWKEDNGRFRY